MEESIKPSIFVVCGGGSLFLELVGKIVAGRFECLIVTAFAALEAVAALFVLVTAKSRTPDAPCQ
jgi:hypothetical protein